MNNEEPGTTVSVACQDLSKLEVMCQKASHSIFAFADQGLSHRHWHYWVWHQQPPYCWALGPSWAATSALLLVKPKIQLLSSICKKKIVLLLKLERKIYSYLEIWFTKLSVTSERLSWIQYSCMHLIWSNLIIFEVTLVSTYQPLS